MVSKDMQKEDMLRAISHCAKCKLCSIADFHSSGEEWLPICPSGMHYKFQTFYSPGRLEVLREVVEGKISSKSDALLKVVYACTLCGSCYERCKKITKVELDHTELFEELRVLCKERGWISDVHKEISKKIADTHNAYGETSSTLNLQYNLKGDILYFIGCTSKYREVEIANAMLEILKNTGINFAVMDEWCCGSPLIRTGQIDQAKEVMNHNIALIKENGFKSIVFTCPGCMMTFKKNYPDLGVNLLHSSEFINQQINDGSLKLKNFDRSFTYHDPCHLGRHLGIYEEPRKTLENIGVKIKEMKRFKSNSWCCGAGGGVKSAFKEFAEWSGKKRIEEAKSIGVNNIITACPFCKRNLMDAANGAFKIYDIAEIVNIACK